MYLLCHLFFTHVFISIIPLHKLPQVSLTCFFLLLCFDWNHFFFPSLMLSCSLLDIYFLNSLRPLISSALLCVFNHLSSSLYEENQAFFFSCNSSIVFHFASPIIFEFLDFSPSAPCISSPLNPFPLFPSSFSLLLLIWLLLPALLPLCIWCWFLFTFISFSPHSLLLF